MTTEKQIKAEYKELHDLLSESYYNFHNISKEEFDGQHGVIWKNMEDELIAEGYLTIPEPPRDLAAEVTAQKAEIDELKANIKELKKR